jgi:hypothetical protein
MGKFKVRLKVTGFELEVEGSRDDVPLIADSVGQQFVGLLKPAADIVEGEIVSDDGNSNHPPAIQESESKKRRTSRRRPTGTGSATPNQAQEAAIDWVHDPAKWGSPQQSWKTAQKAMWLLYVVGKEKHITEVSATQIAQTFNKHFKQAKTILRGNVARDLGKLKMGADAVVSENTTKTPSTWFLTLAGDKLVQELISKTLGQTDAAKGTAKE